MSSMRNQLSGIKNRQQFLYIMVFSMAAVGVWVGGSIFSSQAKSGIDPALQKLALPLNPSINVEILDRIQAKREYSDSELSNFGIFKVVSSKDGKQDRVVTIDVPDDVLETQAENTPPVTTQTFGELSNPSSSQSASPSTNSPTPLAPTNPVLPAL